jgi:enamine deaminase RidA (YjgF/YER057c/UK114 family)
MGGQPNGGGGYNGTMYNGVYPANTGRLIPQSPEFQAQTRQTLQQLQQLQQQMKGDPATQKDIAALMQQLRQIDPTGGANDALLTQRILDAMSNVEQVETEIRRKVDDATGGNVRSTSSEKVPPGYSDATAEYFKKLSKSSNTPATTTGTGKQQ